MKQEKKNNVINLRNVQTLIYRPPPKKKHNDAMNDRMNEKIEIRKTSSSDIERKCRAKQKKFMMKSIFCVNI